MEVDDPSFSVFSAKTKPAKRKKLAEPEDLLTGKGAVKSSKQVARNDSHALQTDRALMASGSTEGAPEANLASTSNRDLEDATFKSIGLSDWLCSVCSSLGMTRPTEVQAGCIPAVLKVPTQQRFGITYATGMPWPTLTPRVPSLGDLHPICIPYHNLLNCDACPCCSVSLPFRRAGGSCNSFPRSCLLHAPQRSPCNLQYAPE